MPIESLFIYSAIATTSAYFLQKLHNKQKTLDSKKKHLLHNIDTYYGGGFNHDKCQQYYLMKFRIDEETGILQIFKDCVEISTQISKTSIDQTQNIIIANSIIKSSKKLVQELMFKPIFDYTKFNKILFKNIVPSCVSATGKQMSKDMINKYGFCLNLSEKKNYSSLYYSFTPFTH